MRRLSVGLAVLLLFGSATSAQAPAASSSEIEKRVESLLTQMTLEEKIDILGGVDGFYVRAMPRIGLPRLRMADGPFGVRNYGPATTVAGGIGLAATWDRRSWSEWARKSEGMREPGACTSCWENRS